jgi:molybdate transport system substrate-binding protein
MQKAGVYDRVKGNLVLGENISQAAEFVVSGAAQVGILGISMALSDAMRGKGKYWEVPTDTYPVMEQAGIILRHARESGNLDAARSFMRALHLHNLGCSWPATELRPHDHDLRGFHQRMLRLHV